jgi:hypothetical protein
MTARQDQQAAQLVAGHVIPQDSPRAGTSTDAAAVDHDAIAAEAYALWAARGQRDGSDMEDWLEAERRLRQGAGLNGDGGRSR